MVEADHAEAPAPSLSKGVDVVSGIDDEAAGGIVGDVAGSNGFQNVGFVAQQHAAAFRGQRLTGMRRDRVDDSARGPDGYNASTAIAMPMPPPMQSDATP